MTQRRVVARSLGAFGFSPLIGGTGQSEHGERANVAGARQSADQGDAKAQFNLGLMYVNGRGVPQDDAQALAWFSRGFSLPETVALLVCGLAAGGSLAALAAARQKAR